MRVAVRIPGGQPVTEMTAAAELADRAGFDTIAVPDSPTLFRDTFIALALMATRTTTATLASTVTSFVIHDPVALASTMRTLEELAPGRIRMGVGAGDNIAFLTGLPALRTAAIRSGVETVSALLRGETVTVRGTEVTIQDPLGHGVPVFLAADGPRNLALAAEIADGVITWSGDLERKSAQIEAAKVAHGRTRPLHRVITTTVCITDDIARDAWYQKPYVLRFAQRVGPQYLEQIGFDGPLPDDNLVLHGGVDMGHPRDLDAAATFASQWISDDFAVWYARNVLTFGSANEVSEKLLALKEFGADEIQVTDGASFTVPTRLINDMAEQVLPALHAA